MLLSPACTRLCRYACPDLTGKPGYWAKALTERYAESNALIHYYFTTGGDVHFGVNGVDKGLFFSGLDTRQVNNAKIWSKNANGKQYSFNVQNSGVNVRGF